MLSTGFTEQGPPSEADAQLLHPAGWLARSMLCWPCAAATCIRSHVCSAISRICSRRLSMNSWLSLRGRRLPEGFRGNTLSHFTPSPTPTTRPRCSGFCRAFARSSFHLGKLVTESCELPGCWLSSACKLNYVMRRQRIWMQRNEVRKETGLSRYQPVGHHLQFLRLINW